MGSVQVGLLIALVLRVGADAQAPPGISVSSYPSIQAALDDNPGRVVYVPAGQHRVSEPVFLRGDASGLTGPGTIVQNDPGARIIAIEDLSDVRIEGLILTRPGGARETRESAVLATRCERLRLESVRVGENRSVRGAIELRSCRNCTVQDCEVLNYKRLSIDDRMDSALYGYAFNCIDGTGIWVEHSVGTRITGNRIVEERLLPTREVVEANDLGKVVRRLDELGSLAPTTIEREGIVTNWHQGSGMLVTGPEDTLDTTIAGNTIENAAQGIDIHADRVVVTGNTVTRAFMGMKAMHGSSSVLISGNVFSEIDLWGILLCPGSAATEENPQRGIVVANNIIADMGYGLEHWHWGSGGSAIKLGSDGLPESPPMENVIIQGNLVQTRDPDAPRYQWAVRIDQDRPPENVHFSGNLLQPGANGVSNVPLAD